MFLGLYRWQDFMDYARSLQEKIEFFRAQAAQYHFSREYAKAMEFYVRAGILGDRDSVAEVCRKLRSGYGMSCNYNELFRCMLVGAVKFEMPEAMAELARCYQSGIGTVVNRKKAAEWLERSGLDLAVGEDGAD